MATNAFESPFGSIDNSLPAPGDVLVAQVTAAETPPLRTIIEIGEGSILQLPEGTSIASPRANGTDLEFVQPDGSVIVVPNGAITGLTIFVGELSFAPEVTEAMFSAAGIETAIGPDAAAAALAGGRANFSIPTGTVGPGGTLIDLLDFDNYDFPVSGFEDLADGFVARAAGAAAANSLPVIIVAPP